MNRNNHINMAIMENELSTMEWELSDLAWELYWWVSFFNIAFFKDEPVPVPAISFESTRINNLGHYVIGRNAFGIRENINLNRKHLGRPLWDILATFLHELCHSWENLYIPESKRTKNWFHKIAFRSKLTSFGIQANEKGCHIGVGDPFVHLLRQHAVPFVVDIEIGGFAKIQPKKRPKGKSKLKKWQCPCGQNVRVGKKSFHAVCTLCDGEFTLST